MCLVKYNLIAFKYKIQNTFEQECFSIECILTAITMNRRCRGPHVTVRKFRPSGIFGPTCSLREQYMTCSDVTRYNFIYDIYKNRNNVAQT